MAQGERQAGAEVEVTPEMIEAGVDAMYHFHLEPREDEEREAVEKIFRAMISARIENTL